MKLLFFGFEEVGIGFVVEVHPLGQWLGQWLGHNIPPLLVKFILEQPSNILLDAKNLFLELCYKDCSTLIHVVNWIIP